MIGLLKTPMSIANQVERKFETHLWYFIESVGGPEQGYRHCFVNVTNRNLRGRRRLVFFFLLLLEIFATTVRRIVVFC